MSIIRVDLAKAHFFPDLTPIPERLHKVFDIEVYDDMEADGDWAVSDAIQQLGVWEPVETAVLSSAFAGNPDSTFVDIGCHVGWYSVIARQWGLPVYAIDANVRNFRMLMQRLDMGIDGEMAWIAKGWTPFITAWPEPCIVKMDIEGNERYAVDAMWDLFDVGSVTHCLMEVSPVFNGSYPALLTRLIDVGYECWVLPPKCEHPLPMDDTNRWLHNACIPLHMMTDRDEWVAAQHQFNAVFCKADSLWG